MSHRITGAGLALAALLALAGTAATDEPKKEEKKSEGQAAADLGLEVHALRLLYHLQATSDQMQSIQKVGKETAPPASERTGKASKEYLDLLGQLRDALAAAEDADKIDELEAKLDELAESETPTLDDGVDLTEAARRRAPEVLRLFRPAQVATYFGEIADDVPDPVRRFQEAMNKVRTLKLSEWKEQKEEIAQDISYLLAGADADKLEQMNEKAIGLLGKVRVLKDEEFKQQKPELEKQAKQIIGDIGPTDVLRNILEYGLAEMLSNPRLDAALKARLGK